MPLILATRMVDSHKERSTSASTTTWRIGKGARLVRWDGESGVSDVRGNWLEDLSFFCASSAV